MAYHVKFYEKEMKIYCILFDTCRQNEKIKSFFNSNDLHYSDYITNSWTATSLISLFSGKTPSELYHKGVGYYGTYKSILTDSEKEIWDEEMVLNCLPKDWNIHIHAMGPTRGDTKDFRFFPDEICGIKRKVKYYEYKKDIDEESFVKEMQSLSNEDNHFIFLKYNHYHDALSLNDRRLKDESIDIFLRVLESINFEEENSLFWIFSDHGEWQNIDEHMRPPDSWLTWASVTDNITNKKVSKDLIYMCDFKNTILNRIFSKKLPNDVLDNLVEDRIYVCEDGRSVAHNNDYGEEDSRHKYSTTVSAIKKVKNRFIQLSFHSPNKESKTIFYDNSSNAIKEVKTNEKLLNFLKNGVWEWYFNYEW